MLPLLFLDYYLWLAICLVIRTSLNFSLTTIPDIHTFLQSSGSGSHGAGGHKGAPAAKGVIPKLRAEKVSHSSTRFWGKALNTSHFFCLQEGKAASDIGDNKKREHEEKWWGEKRFPHWHSRGFVPTAGIIRWLLRSNKSRPHAFFFLQLLDYQITLCIKSTCLKVGVLCLQQKKAEIITMLSMVPFLVKKAIRTAGSSDDNAALCNQVAIPSEIEQRRKIKCLEDVRIQ